MPIALSEGRVIHRLFVAATPAGMVEIINTTLQACDWISTAVTGGYRLQGVSPQGLNIYLYVRDLGHTFQAGPLEFIPQCTFNFETIDGAFIGMDHEMIPTLGTCQIVAGCCYLWVSILGMAFHAGGSHFCGQIPFAPDAAACGEAIPALSTNQCFWASGDSVGDVGPRGALLTNGTMSQSEALWNTDYCAGGSAVGSPRFSCLTWASHVFGGFDLPSLILWRNGDDFELEPTLCWGTSNAAIPQLRTQAYDCMIFTDPVAMDTRQTRNGRDYLAFTNLYRFGCLHLIIPTGSFSEGNYAFIST